MNEQPPMPNDPGQMGPEGPSSDERTWAAITHLAALSTFVIGIGFIVGPLIPWLIKRDEMPFVDEAGKESLNFNISWFIWALVTLVLWLVLVGIALSIILGVAWLVLVVVAGVKASNGEQYRYPLTIRFIR